MTKLNIDHKNKLISSIRYWIGKNKPRPHDKEGRAYRDLRIAKGYNLRKFCSINKLDVCEVSRLELGHISIDSLPLGYHDAYDMLRKN